MNRIGAALLLTAGSLANSGYDRLSISSLERGCDDRDVAAARTPAYGVRQHRRRQRDTYARGFDPETLPVRRRLPIADGIRRSKEARDVSPAHLRQRFWFGRSLQPSHQRIWPQRLI